MKIRLLSISALALGLVLALPATPALAQAAAGQLRSPDVIYVPTPPEVVAAMLKVAKVGPGDVIYDLGSGDGRIVIAAVKDFGAARGTGIDIDPQRIKEANANAATNKVTDKVRFLNQDLFTTNLSEATVISLVSAAQPQPEAAAEADGRAQARHAHRVARLRHGRLGAGTDARRRRPQGVLLDHP